MSERRAIRPPRRDRSKSKRPSGRSKSRRAAVPETVKKEVWVSAADLVKMEFEDRPWITPGVLRRGGLVLCHGAMKIGKTALWVQYSMAAATGRKFWDLPTTRGTVLYAQLENPDSDAKEELERLSNGDKAPKFLIISTMDRFPDEGMLPELQRAVATYKPILVVVDPILVADDSFAFSGGNKRIAAVFKELRKFAITNKFTLVLIHHSNKDLKQDFLLGALGPAAVTAIPDVVIQMSRPRGKVRGTIKISGRGIEEREIYMDYPNGIWKMAEQQEPQDEKSTELKTARLAVIRAKQPIGPTDLAKALGVSRVNTIQVWLDRMVGEGQVIKSEAKGKYEIAPEVEEVEPEPEPKKRRRISFEDDKKDEKK